MGHDSEATTFVGYGEVASHRQKEIMTALANRRLTRLAGLDVSALGDLRRTSNHLLRCQP